MAHTGFARPRAGYGDTALKPTFNRPPPAHSFFYPYTTHTSLSTLHKDVASRS